MTDFYCPGDISWWMTEGSTVQTEEDTAPRILWREPRIPATPVFIEVGLRLGVENYYKYFKRFGLMKQTGIDLPGEAGTLCTKWKTWEM